jgi:TRAP transporter TAXI family solute receptor
MPIADTSLVADLTLRAFGIDPKEVKGELSGITDAVEQVADGRFDAMFVNASYPFSLLQPAFERGARLVPITGPALDDLIEQYPFIRAVTIPAGTYPGQAEAVSTIGVNVVLVCGAELDERLVYDLTRTFFEALPQLTAAQSSLRLMDPEQAPATPIPLHEGAARYYRESELFR